ncbi:MULTISPECIES: hypothetical protein [Bacillus amyloliquefaciens group]|uniref:hypothetical protein n=1 Tax=Bacillus amyloliquefaciens group TaxID=1938374 RepID=UPI0010516852|nr:hypothetical protein [Bacillus velezensis]MCY0092138.1 hypothetical protein [Bacillus velezensis]MEC0385626.1 hypothetical protein [Bacillus velezensis]MEC0388768.1 hypothetical protein [Bacillus velezensis]HEO2443525.1 hypothetical protein [Streptococcus agalactiae]
MGDLNLDTNIQWLGEETTSNPLKITINKKVYNNAPKYFITMNKFLKELITESRFEFWQIGIKKENNNLKLFFRFTLEDEGGAYSLVTTEGKLKPSFQHKELLEKLTQQIFFHLKDFSKGKRDFETTAFQTVLTLTEAPNMQNTYVAEIKPEGFSQKLTKVKLTKSN